MAKTKKTDLFTPLSKVLTEEELEYAKYLYQVYVDELAGSADMTSTRLKRFNYQGLFELGCHTPNPIISKLVKDGSNLSCHLIVAHGYVRNRF